MQITITFINKQGEQDFQLNSEMNIKEALEIIASNSQFQCSKTKYLFSKRKNEKISCEHTFQEAQIYSGDCLRIEEE